MVLSERMKSVEAWEMAHVAAAAQGIWVCRCCCILDHSKAMSSFQVLGQADSIPVRVIYLVFVICCFDSREGIVLNLF
jgi:hypothetical protein